MARRCAVRVAAAMPDWNGPTFRLLEIALLAPGEDTWPRILTVAAERDERTGSGSLLRLFGLAGPDRVLSALESESVAVRLAAIDEVSRLLDLRAAPRLLSLRRQPGPGARRGAQATPVAAAPATLDGADLGADKCRAALVLWCGRRAQQQRRGVGWVSPV